MNHKDNYQLNNKSAIIFIGFIFSVITFVVFINSPFNRIGFHFLMASIFLISYALYKTGKKSKTKEIKFKILISLALILFLVGQFHVF